MILLSTLKNFAEGLPPDQKTRFGEAMSLLRVQTVALNESDKVRTVLDPSCTTLEVVPEDEIEAALGCVDLVPLMEAIRKRAFLITPVGEWGALVNYEQRVGSNGSRNTLS